jgi:hypothetical protein
MTPLNQFMVGCLCVTFLCHAGIAQSQTGAPAQIKQASPKTQATPQKAIPQLGAPTAWYLSGNVQTDPRNNFIGTSDAQPLIFRTNNIEQMRINADGLTRFRKLLLGYGTSDGSKPKTPFIEFYSPQNSVSISSPSPGLLSINRAQGASGIALDVNGDLRASGKIITTSGIAFPDGTVQATAKINKGDKGDPGPMGPAGLQGPQGAAGSGSVIAGRVDRDGKILAGKGFSITHTAGSGFYEIVFPGSGATVCTASSTGGYGSMVLVGTRSVATYWWGLPVTGKGTGNLDAERMDIGFNFICAVL